MAVRAATEAAGGEEAQEFWLFWLGFDLQGPEVLQRYQGQEADRRTRGQQGGGGGVGPGAVPQPTMRQPPPLPSPPQPTQPSPPPPPQIIGDAAQLQELVRPDHPMWLFLRRAPIEKFVMRPQLIPKKHFTNKIIVTQLERAIKGRWPQRDAEVWTSTLIIMRKNSLHA